MTKNVDILSLRQSLVTLCPVSALSSIICKQLLHVRVPCESFGRKKKFDKTIYPSVGGKQSIIRLGNQTIHPCVPTVVQLFTGKADEIKTLKTWFLEVVPSITIWCTKPDRIAEWKFSSVDVCEFEETWAPDASCRWPQRHAELVDICITFSRLMLPPYVLLRIVSFLPQYHDSRTTRFKRIQTIEGVHKSNRKIRVGSKKEIALEKAFTVKWKT